MRVKMLTSSAIILLQLIAISEHSTRVSADDVKVLTMKIGKLNRTLQTIHAKINQIENLRTTIEGTQKKVENHLSSKEKELSKSKVSYTNAAEHIANKFLNKRKSRFSSIIRKNLTTTKNSYYAFLKEKGRNISTLSKRLDEESKQIYNNAIAAHSQFSKEVVKVESVLNKFDSEFVKADVDRLANRLSSLKKWLKLQNFNEMQHERTQSASGLKQIPSLRAGRYSFLSDSFCAKDGLAGMNDKSAATRRQLAFGPVDFGLNGIAFRVNRKSYSLFRSKYNPKIPDEIVSDTPIKDQIAIMRRYFTAFEKQDVRIAQHRDYFHSHISFIEGSWRMGNNNEAHELFQYCTETGAPDDKCASTNYFPRTSILESDNFNSFSQFQYRVSSSQVQVELNCLKVVNDLSNKKRLGLNENKWRNSNCVRFTLNHCDKKARQIEAPIRETYTDKVMSEIVEVDTSTDDDQTHFKNQDHVKRKRIFHRLYRNLNNNKEEAPFSGDQFYSTETEDGDVVGPARNGNTSRQIYAAPLEVVITTPLISWNPYNLKHYTSCNDMEGDGTYQNPYTGTCPGKFFRTPLQFFRDNTNDRQHTCKANNGVFVKVNTGDKRNCFLPSGTHVVLPAIDGIRGNIRTRYPIVSVFSEENPDWKKLKSIEERFDYEVLYEMGESSEKFGYHKHVVKVALSVMQNMKIGDVIQRKTEEGNSVNHQHILTLKKVDDGFFEVISCDSGDDNGVFCFDQHIAKMTQLPV